MTTCLTDSEGHPLALPPNTKLEGAGDAVVVVAENGERFAIGDEIAGGGSLQSADEIAANYGAGLPTECGAAPWLVIHDGLQAYRES